VKVEPLADSNLQQEIERFLSLESYLLDHRCFEDWVDLFVGDGLYCLPNYDEHGSPPGGVAVIRETRDELAAHVARLNHPLAITEQPPYRTRHLVTNVLIWPDENDVPRVTCNSAVFLSRPTDSHQFVATCEYRLRRVDDGWRIVEKCVYLLTNDQPLPPLTLL